MTEPENDALLMGNCSRIFQGPSLWPAWRLYVSKFFALGCRCSSASAHVWAIGLAFVDTNPESRPNHDSTKSEHAVVLYYNISQRFDRSWPLHLHLIGPSFAWYRPENTQFRDVRPLAVAHNQIQDASFSQSHNHRIVFRFAFWRKREYGIGGRCATRTAGPREFRAFFRQFRGSTTAFWSIFFAPASRAC